MLQAQIPQTLSYQGVLTDNSGVNVTDGNYDLTFNLYAVETGGSALWTETQSVSISDGIFNVILGKVTSIDLPFDNPYWLGITVGTGTELTPRIELTSAAYSLNALSVMDNSVTGASIQNNQIVRSVNNIKDDVTISAGDNVSITNAGNSITISAETSGSGGNTLDQAYDQGGAGAGRTITADAGAFKVGGTDGALFTGTYSSGTIPVEGAGTRMMWYPNKAAFRAGDVSGTQWDDSNIGKHSFATGYNTTASEPFSTAMGSGTTASGYYSTAIGREIEAQGYYSVAIALNDQNGTTVTQNNTMAIMGGKVGIGTVSPAATFEVFNASSGSNRTVYIENNNNTSNPASGIWSVTNGSGGFQHYAVAARASGATYQNVGLHSEATSNSADMNYGTYTLATGAPTNFGIYAVCDGNGQAGRFVGDVFISGSISKGSGTFKIDHPLDPQNKYLNHSFVESPDMMNIYNGNVILDSNGEVPVELPQWFGVLNKEFRYQLTCIGGFAQVYIAEEINNNRFKIAGGTPGLKVSWQVTGIRQDPYANKHRVQVEELKDGYERGKYLYPEVYGLDKTMGIDYKNISGLRERK